MIIVGINSYFEHPAVAVIADGKVCFAAEDERFTGIKHGCRYSPYRTYLPVRALYHALRTCGIRSCDVTEIAYSYSGVDHLLSLWGCLTGRRFSTVREEFAAWRSLRHVRASLCGGYEIPTGYRAILDPSALAAASYSEWNHHLAHAASAFHCSGFDEALTVVSDGAGEASATSVYVGRGSTLVRIGRVDLPHSLGILYSLVTRHLGFEPFADEYKVMGLAAYGTPTYAEAFRRLVTLRQPAAYRIDKLLLQNLEAILGPARAPDAPLESTHMNIARSLQQRLEEALEHVVTAYLSRTRLRRLCLAGGTFMNCVANGRLAVLPGVDEVFVQPAAHDAGTALGAAILSHRRLGGAMPVTFSSASLGTSYADKEMVTALRDAGIPYRRLTDEALVDEIAARLERGQIGALFRGRMEFGSRALGMRSIIASPSAPNMRDRLNAIKGREDFRPVAPMVVGEAFDRFFEGVPNRYMAMTARVRAVARPLIPAAVHVDGTARPQVVWVDQDPFMHALLCACERRTGVPVVINTSLNLRGKPIVESPIDALACFCTSSMEFLVLGQLLVSKVAASV